MRITGVLSLLLLAACPAVPPDEGEGEAVGEGEGERDIGEGDVGEGEGDVGEGEGEGERALTCPTARVQCGEQCVDVRRDELNCGVCGLACSGDDVCSNGACTSPCRNPHFDDDVFAANAPELVGCQPRRWHVEGDGVIDNVCGTHIIRTSPAFSVVPTGLPAQSFRGFELDPTPGLESFSASCDVNNSGRVVFDAPAGLVCELVPTDIDRDGDYDVVSTDGRVFMVEAGVWSERAPIPAPPGPVAAVRWGGALELVSVAAENGEVLLNDGSAWVPIATVRVSSTPVLFAVAGLDGDDRLFVDQGPTVRPATFRCERPIDGRSTCLVAFASSVGPPAVANDTSFVGSGLAADLMNVTGATGLGAMVAVDEAAGYHVQPNGDVFRRDLVDGVFGLAADAIFDGARLPITVEGDELRFNGVVTRLPAGTPMQLIVEPKRNVVWIVFSGYPTGEDALRAFDLATGNELHSVAATRTYYEVPSPAFFDVDGDDDLDLVAGGVVIDLVTGEMLEAEGRVFGDIDGDGDVEEVSGECPNAASAYDVDGDGIDDVVAPDRVCFGGPLPRREELVGAGSFPFVAAGIDVDGNGGLEVQRFIDGRTHLVSPSVDLDLGPGPVGVTARRGEAITWTGEGRPTEARPIRCNR